MKEQLNKLLTEFKTLSTKVKNKLRQLTNMQNQIKEFVQQKTSLQEQIDQLQKQVLNQSDKNLLSQCVNALNPNGSIFTNGQTYHTWFNNAANINNSGAKEEIKNLAVHLRNYLNTSKNIIDQKNNIQNQLNESNRKLETVNKENTENEKVLQQIFTEMQQLEQQMI